MDRNLRKFVGAALVATLIAACKGDPTSGLSGGAATISSSVGFLTMNIGDSVQVTATVRDASGNPVETVPAAAIGDAAVATATTVTSADPLIASTFYVKALGPGATDVVLSSGSAVDTVKVVVFPLVFDGTVAAVTTGQLDTIVITASTLIGFDSTKTTVTVGGLVTHLVSVSATQVKVEVLAKAASTANTVHITNVVFLGAFPLAALDASTTVNVRGDATELNNSTGTATTLTLTGTANTTVDGVFDGTTDVDDYYKIVLTATTTVTAEVDFDGAGANPDIDMYILDATGLASICGAPDPGCPAASAKQPEKTTSATLVAGTYYVYLNFFDKGTAVTPFWYRLLVKKNS